MVWSLANAVGEPTVTVEVPAASPMLALFTDVDSTGASSSSTRVMVTSLLVMSPLVALRTTVSASSSMMSCKTRTASNFPGISNSVPASRRNEVDDPATVKSSPSVAVPLTLRVMVWAVAKVEPPRPGPGTVSVLRTIDFVSPSPIWLGTLESTSIGGSSSSSMVMVTEPMVVEPWLARMTTVSASSSIRSGTAFTVAETAVAPATSVGRLLLMV